MAKRPIDLPKDIDAFLNKVVSGTIKTMQEELGSKKVSPYDTGRLRSSWFAAEGNPSGAVAAEGTDSPNTDASSLKVDWRRRYYLTSNLPYSQVVCEEGRVNTQPVTWFRDFIYSRAPKIIDTQVKKAKL